MSDKKEHSISDIRRPGRPGSRFAEIQYAENVWLTLKRIWMYFSKERLLVLSLLFFVITGTVFRIIVPSLQSDAIDVITVVCNKAQMTEADSSVSTSEIAKQSKNIDINNWEKELKHYLVYMIFAAFIVSLMTLIQGICSARLSQNIVKRMREELFSKIVDLPISYLDSHSHGDVMSRMTNDIESISNTVSQSLPSLFSGCLTLIGTAGIMLWYCWQLALLSLSTVFLTLLVSNVISVKVRKYSKQRSEFLGQLNGTVEEVISGYRTVVAYNHQKISWERFAENSDKLTSAGIKVAVFSGIMGPLMNCISNIGFVIIAAFGGYFAYKGIITIGVISAFIVYAKQFSRPVNEIASIYGQLQTAIASAERVFKVLDEPCEDMHGKECNIENEANIEFKNVNFSYVPGVPIIKNFTLSVPPGKKVALVGSTGCGKTTITNLLLRFYDLDSGEILINGQNIAEISRASLRKKIDIVLQDTVLFTDTIRNNLKYANADATDEEMEKAVKLSRSNSLVDSMTDGYDTILTAAGANISQGQKQLLTIARAFVADPKILILDEATSSVDTRTEKAIQDAMQQIMQNRTSIVIAHRLSTIKDADMIIVMDHGEIVEKGTHESLLNDKGKYYDLYMTQFAGFAT